MIIVDVLIISDPDTEAAGSVLSSSLTMASFLLLISWTSCQSRDREASNSFTMIIVSLT